MSDGIYDASVGPGIIVSDCIVSNNSGHGIIASIHNWGEATPLTIEHCRIIDNSLDGIVGYGCTVNYSVLDGNGTGINVHSGSFQVTLYAIMDLLFL